MILTYEEAKALSTSSDDTLTVIRNTKRAWCIAVVHRRVLTKD